MQQQHAFSGSNIEAAMTNQQQQQQHQQQSGGQVDSQMVSNDPSSLYHSHHLPPLQQQQPQQQPSTPTSGRAQAQHSTAQQHHRPIANQQINLNHGQTMPLQQQQQQQQPQQQQQSHHSQHHSMVANGNSIEKSERPPQKERKLQLSLVLHFVNPRTRARSQSVSPIRSHPQHNRKGVVCLKKELIGR